MFVGVKCETDFVSFVILSLGQAEKANVSVTVCDL